MPPLGSAKKAAASTAETASPAADAAATAGLARYPATERARSLLDRGINPLPRHLHPNTTWVLSIQTNLCSAGAQCEGRNCSYAHSPGELLSRPDNALLIEVARRVGSEGHPRRMEGRGCRGRTPAPAATCWSRACDWVRRRAAAQQGPEPHGSAPGTGWALRARRSPRCWRRCATRSWRWRRV